MSLLFWADTERSKAKVRTTSSFNSNHRWEENLNNIAFENAVLMLEYAINYFKRIRSLFGAAVDRGALRYHALRYSFVAKIHICKTSFLFLSES